MASKFIVFDFDKVFYIWRFFKSCSLVWHIFGILFSIPYVRRFNECKMWIIFFLHNRFPYIFIRLICKVRSGVFNSLILWLVHFNICLLFWCWVHSLKNGYQKPQESYHRSQSVRFIRFCIPAFDGTLQVLLYLQYCCR